MVDKDLFEVEMKKAKLTYEKLSELLGISTTSLWRKVGNKTEFKSSEIQNLIKIFGLKDVTPIFFA